jgi:glucokinase
VLATLAQAIDDLRTPFGPVQAIGVACAGQVAPSTGVVVRAPNLEWIDVPLAATLTERFSLPVTVENDVRAAAWGEFRFGAGRTAQSVVVVFVGTGLGSGAVLDGRLWLGAGNAAGEVGHTQMVPDGLPCPCGQRGCLEQYVSGSGFRRRFATALAAGVSTRLAGLTRRDPDRLTAAMVADAARGGDPLAREMWSDATRFLPIGLANYVTLLNPDLLILGGGVIETVPALADVVASGVPALTTELSRRSLRVVRAELGDWSGVIGAADLARARVIPRAPSS